MKIFLVGDNSANANWGRAASLALNRLLLARGEIVGCVPGEMFVLNTARAAYVHTLWPRRFYGLFRQVLRRRHSRRLFSAYLRLESLWGAHDFVSEDPRTTADTLLACRHRYPEFARIHDQMMAADAVVVDGDGDLVFTTPPRREALFIFGMIELGLRLGRPVCVVNTMLSDCPTTGRNDRTVAAAAALFARCRSVAVRDPESLAYLRAVMPRVPGRLIPDSLFSWYPLLADPQSRPPANGDFLQPFPESARAWGQLDFSVPYLCLGGGALAATDPERARRSYERLVDALRPLGCPIYLTENDRPDAFLRSVAESRGLGLVPVTTPILMAGSVLAHARLFISGRYHPSILAALGGTPCIFLGSHAHKMGSLPRLLDYGDERQFDAFPDEAAVAQIVALARRYLDDGDALRGRNREVAKRRCDEAARLPDFIGQSVSAGIH